MTSALGNIERYYRPKKRKDETEVEFRARCREEADAWERLNDDPSRLPEGNGAARRVPVRYE